MENETQVVRMSEAEVRTAFIKGEEYLAMLEEINAAIVEGEYAVRRTRLEFWHNVGGSIRDFMERHEGVGPTVLVREICKDLKVSEKTVWDVYRLNKLYPRLEDLEGALGGGKNVSFTRARKELLGSGDKTDPEIDLAKVARGIVKRYGNDNARVIAQEVLNTLSEATE